jgi:hypothetical protein
VMTALISLTPFMDASVRSMRSKIPFVRSAPSRMTLRAYAWRGRRWTAVGWDSEGRGREGMGAGWAFAHEWAGGPRGMQVQRQDTGNGAWQRGEGQMQALACAGRSACMGVGALQIDSGWAHGGPVRWWVHMRGAREHGEGGWVRG